MNTEISHTDIGNSRRGYHNTNTRIRFVYDDKWSWTTERERKIVLAIVPQTGLRHTVTRDDDAWLVNHGYDSSD